MRSFGGRSKKLIVALHFERDKAGWECDRCRKAGLENQRRCGFLPQTAPAAAPVVWARNGISTATCPKSFVTAQSIAWLEEFFVRRRLGWRDLDQLGAREVEAFLILENALEAERNHG